MRRRRATRARGAGGTASASGAPPPPQLSAKYAAVCEKYRALVAKYEEASGERSSATVLALAAMRAGVTAVAAIRDGACLVRNTRWLSIARDARDRGGPWRLLLGDGGSAAPADADATLERLALAGAAELIAAGEASRTSRWERGDGDVVVEMRLERTAHTSPPLVLAMISDVTDRVRSQRELARMRAAMEAQERLRALGELASGIAHDLNNTLHAMRLRLARVAACEASCPEHAEDLRVIERITADASARVRRLQDLARRREDVPDERLDLAAAVSSAVEVVRPALGDPSRPLAVDVRLPPLPAVVGNASEIGHVFVNLLSNARDAMGPGGRVAIEGRVASDGYAEITVADDGTGIPPEMLGRIFDPFFTTKGRRGTGLGLSMAASVMRRLGGAIQAQNRAGGGAAFTLRFPPAPRGGARPVAAREDAPSRLPPRRVLVVDDDPDNLDAMRLVLADLGQRADVTASGVDAAARVERGERYDLVLCDLGLGDASGWDVAARVASAAPGTSVALVTGWAEEIPVDDPRRRLVVRVLAKPLDLGELRAVLRDAAPALRPAGEEVPAGARGGAPAHGAAPAHP